MIENKYKRDKEIDTLILNELKNKMKINKDKVNVLHDEEIEEILKKINEKMELIFLLFEGEFAINERIIEEKMEIFKRKLNVNDRIANRIIIKRLDAVIQNIENLEPLNGQLISVCWDRKLFIHKILKENISLLSVQKNIQIDENER